MGFFAQNEFEKTLEEMIVATPAPGRHAARSAIRHLEKAAVLAETDPEMAAFRAITAEEEAATAVFHALRRHQYLGANRLSPRNHVHKNALLPFCQAAAALFSEADLKLRLQPRLRILDADGPKRLQLELHGGSIGLGDRFFSPQPPLHFSVSAGDKLHDFADELQELASSRKANTILTHLRTRANFRNQILYASSDGVPQVLLGGHLNAQRLAVKSHLTLYLLIDPYDEHQLFVTQCVDAFLKMLAIIPAGGEEANGSP